MRFRNRVNPLSPCLTPTRSSRTFVPELRSGDVVAIMSNGGFGGIHEKILERPPSQLDSSDSVHKVSAHAHTLTNYS